MTDYPRFDAARAAILEHALGHAAFDGWTRRVLVMAARDAGLPEGADELYFPRGPVDAIDFWNLQADAAARTALAEMDLGAMRVREKIEAAVMARLAPAAEHPEAARRAAARLMLPDGAATQARIVWRAADTMWSAVGDTSTDGNWYSKRAILSGVYAATFAVMLDDKDPELAGTRAFLKRRIDGVLQFEKAKAGWRKTTSRLPDPTQIAARMRYGALRRPAR